MAYKYCGPSRASLLTGRLPGHGISEQMWSSAEADGYNANLTMLPAKLKELGYATHAVGKWHCGYYDRKFLPTSRGFDTYLGYLSGSVDHFSERTSDTCKATGHVTGTDLWKNGDNAVGVNGTYAAFTFTSAAVAIIDEHPFSGPKKQPLFLYLPLQNIHGPDEAPDHYLDQYNASIWAGRRMKDAMATVADESVKNVTESLRRNGALNDTIIVIMSDNGGPIQEPSGGASSGNNWPLRGGKYSLYEGGVRVVGIVSYPRAFAIAAAAAAAAAAATTPKLIEYDVRGSIYSGMIHESDWYPTLITLAGGDPTDTGEGRVPIDGHDVWSAMLTGAPSPRTELLLGMGYGRSGSYRNATTTRRCIGSDPTAEPTPTVLKIIVGHQKVGLMIIRSPREKIGLLFHCMV